MLRSVYFDHQQRSDARRQARGRAIANRLDGATVHQLQRAGSNWLGHDGGDRPRRRAQVAIGGAQSALGLGQRGQLQSRPGDQRKRALGTYDQARQVVADHALGGAGAGSNAIARPGYGHQPQGILARGSVLDRSRSGGIASQIAADGASRSAAWVGRPEKAQPPDRLLECLVCHTRLHHCDTVGRIDAQNALHTLEGQHDAATAGNARPGGASPPSPGR